MKFNERDWEDHNQYDWDTKPAWLWDQVTDGRGWDDEYGKMLYDSVFVDPVDTELRSTIFDRLKEWFQDEYGVDFENVFDWAAWREWYE